MPRENETQQLKKEAESRAILCPLLMTDMFGLEEGSTRKPKVKEYMFLIMAGPMRFTARAKIITQSFKVPFPLPLRRGRGF